MQEGERKASELPKNQPQATDGQEEDDAEVPVRK